MSPVDATEIQGQPVSTVAPVATQVLMFVNGTWVPIPIESATCAAAFPLILF